MRQEESPCAKVERLEREIESLKSKTDEESASQWRNKRKKLAKALYELFHALEHSRPLIAVQCLTQSTWMNYEPARKRLFHSADKASGFREDELIELDKNQLFLKGLQARAGAGHVVNYALAFRCFELAVKKGNNLALLYLGSMYSVGKGIGKDVCSALHYWRKGAELGDPVAQNHLGFAYAHGIGTSKDRILARSWYQKSAEAGYPMAQSNLAGYWHRGEGGDQDYNVAFDWFRKAAEQGVAEGQRKLANLYQYGLGRPKNQALALKWYRKAAKLGDAEAQFALGEAYRVGKGVPDDSDLAKYWYELAAEGENASAMYMLGWMYQRGKVVPQNYELAFRWYTRAQKAGVLPVELGQCYQKGRGVEQNYDLAFFWYFKAANLGVSPAQRKLGRMHFDGLGTPKDNKLALQWYRKAAAQGDEKAITALKKMYLVNLVLWDPDDVVQYREDAQKYLAPVGSLLEMGRETGDFCAAYHLLMMRNDQIGLLKLLEAQPNEFFEQITLDPFLDGKNRLFWIQQLFEEQHRFRKRGESEQNYLQRPKLNSDNLAMVNMEAIAYQYAHLSQLVKRYNKRNFITREIITVVDFGQIEKLKEKIGFLIDVLKTIPKDHARYAEAEFILAHLHYILDQNSARWESHFHLCAQADVEGRWVDNPNSGALYFAFNLLFDFKMAGSDSEKNQALQQKAMQNVMEDKHGLMPMLCLAIMAETQEARLYYLYSIKLTHDRDLSKTQHYLSDLFKLKWSVREKERFENISDDIK